MNIPIINTIHKHSISFIRADTFAKYMGIGYTTNNHKNFSQHLERGDIIGLDKQNNGDRDHMAFVVDRNNYI